MASNTELAKEYALSNEFITSGGSDYRFDDLDPKDLDNVFLYAKYLMLEGSYESAQKLLYLLTMLKPEEVNYQLKLGYCLYQLKQYEQALLRFFQILQIDIGCTLAIYYSGLCLEELNKTDEALKAYETVFTFLPVTDELKENERFKVNLENKIRQLSVA